MGRLIDVDIAIRIVRQYNMFKGLGFVDSLETQISKIPTAYDVDKVVEQLSNNFRKVATDEDLEWNRAIDQAILVLVEGANRPTTLCLAHDREFWFDDVHEIYSVILWQPLPELPEQYKEG